MGGRYKLIIQGDGAVRYGPIRVEGTLEGESRAVREDAVRRIVAEAKKRAPVGETGNLRDLIQVDPDDPTVALSDAFYSSWIEFGTVHITPRPFMTPAVEQVSKDMSGGK